jgi:hypothetical protein
VGLEDLHGHGVDIHQGFLKGQRELAPALLQMHEGAIECRWAPIGKIAQVPDGGHLPGGAVGKLS